MADARIDLCIGYNSFIRIVISQRIILSEPSGYASRKPRAGATATCSAITPMSHPDLTPQRRGALRAPERRSSAIRAVSGYTPCVFRPPYGDTDAAVQDTARSLGLVDGALERRSGRLHPARQGRDRSARASAGAPGLDHHQPRRRRPARADARRLPGHHREAAGPWLQDRDDPRNARLPPCLHPLHRAVRRHRAAARRAAEATRSSNASPELWQSSRGDRRRLDAASDAPLPRTGDVRVAAPVDRRRDTRRASCRSRPRWRDGRRRRRPRRAVRVALGRRAR